MAAKVQIDFDELVAFISALKSFNSKLHGDWGRLKNRWNSLRNTWRDKECEEFLDSAGWREVIRNLESYLQSSDTYVHYLQKKAEPLRHFLNR